MTDNCLNSNQAISWWPWLPLSPALTMVKMGEEAGTDGGGRWFRVILFTTVVAHHPSVQLLPTGDRCPHGTVAGQCGGPVKCSTLSHKHKIQNTNTNTNTNTSPHGNTGCSGHWSSDLLQTLPASASMRKDRKPGICYIRAMSMGTWQHKET